MAGLERYVQILRLFEAGKGEWTIQAMSEALSIPASTTYRLVRELVAQRFLDASTEANYRLGAAFIEFDRRVRLTDPLIGLGIPFLQDLLITAAIPASAVLARLYGSEVICIADAKSDQSQILSSYERGRPMPLLRGATSKAILAQLPTRRLAKLLAAVDDGAQLKMHETLKRDLAAIRQSGYCVTRGEVDHGLVGLAAPVNFEDDGIVASMSLIVRAQDLSPDIERRIIVNIVTATKVMAEQRAR